jgi:hypothetical protein
MLDFDNLFVRDLPGDPEALNVPRQVFGACWSPVDPTPVAAPRLLAYSREVALALDLDEQAMAAPALLAALAGNALLPGMVSYASCYGGHQFGQWAGQLGDGRAILLGEAINRAGQRFELQLKGAGQTPYSRRADGRAVLRSSIREFLCSEAMHHLGVPTTRALSLVTTGESVVRDMFYDGHPVAEPGAIVCRVAPSFTRFGHFELPAARGERALLQRLVEFTIARDFPELALNPAHDPGCLVRRNLRAHRAPDGALDARRLRARGNEYRQHVDPRSDHRLRPLRLGRQLRSRLDAQHHRCIEQTLLFCPATGDRALESRTTGRRAGHADAQSRTRCARLSSVMTKSIPPGSAPHLPPSWGFRHWLHDDVDLLEDLFELMHRAEIDMTEFFRSLARLDIEQPEHRCACGNPSTAKICASASPAA